jgi:hypothetical protein
MGHAVNQLTLVEGHSIVFIGNDGRKRKKELYKCVCGNEKYIYPSDVNRDHTRSCGCLRVKHGESNTRLYRIWCGMKQRITNGNPKSSKYYFWVAMTPEWFDYCKFRDWALANGYRDDLVLNRRNNRVGYCPENCEWVTASQNSRQAVLDKKINPKIIKFFKEIDADETLTEEEAIRKLNEFMEENKEDLNKYRDLLDEIDDLKKQTMGSLQLNIVS